MLIDSNFVTLLGSIMDLIAASVTLAGFLIVLSVGLLISNLGKGE